MRIARRFLHDSHSVMVIRVRAAVVVVGMMMTAAVIAETQAYVRKAITVIPRIVVVGSGVVAVIVRLRICADLVVIYDAAMVIIRRVIYAAALAHQYGCEQQQTK